MFAGFVSLASTIKVRILAKDNNGTPTNAAALPTWRVYGPDGFLRDALVSGTTAFADTGSITNVVNNGSGLCRITSANHGLTTGARVTVTGVVGVSGANITATITKVDSNTYDLDGSTFSGSYSSGGAVNVTGWYVASIDATAANGFAAGQGYDVLFSYSMRSVPHALKTASRTPRGRQSIVSDPLPTLHCIQSG